MPTTNHTYSYLPPPYLPPSVPPLPLPAPTDLEHLGERCRNGLHAHGQVRAVEAGQRFVGGQVREEVDKALSIDVVIGAEIQGGEGGVVLPQVTQPIQRLVACRGAWRGGEARAGAGGGNEVRSGTGGGGR